MSEAEAKAAMVDHWMQKADQALAAALREHRAGDFGLATNRVYYACFYAACAVLLFEGKTLRQTCRRAFCRSPTFYKNG